MEEKLILQTLLGEFRDKLKSLKNLVPRDAQFPDVSNKIKVAIGMRRAGKTYFVYQHILKLIDEGVPPSRILYINFEDDRLLPLKREKLAKLIEAFYTIYPENHDQKCYLFLDEVQNAEEWPIVIRRFHDSKNVEIFLTGSSAKLLSKEIATSLRGRSIATEIWPYSFREFIKSKKVSIPQDLYDKKTKDKLSEMFSKYLSEGGFPEITEYDPDIRNRTLQEYLDVVIYRDVIERHNIKNASLIKFLTLSMIRNVSNPFTINKFYHHVKSQGYRVGKDVLYEYAEHIEDAYLTFLVPIFDKSIRKVQSNPKKLYAVDPGMVRALSLDYEGDLGKLFENVVYLDLRRLGYKINYYLTEERYEIDFLVTNLRGHQKLIQVVWEVDDPKTLIREERALNAAIKETGLEGEIITLDSYLQEGVKPFYS